MLVVLASCKHKTPDVCSRIVVDSWIEAPGVRDAVLHSGDVMWLSESSDGLVLHVGDRVQRLFAGETSGAFVARGPREEVLFVSHHRDGRIAVMRLLEHGEVRWTHRLNATEDVRIVAASAPNIRSSQVETAAPLFYFAGTFRGQLGAFPDYTVGSAGDADGFWGGVSNHGVVSLERLGGASNDAIGGIHARDRVIYLAGQIGPRADVWNTDLDGPRKSADVFVLALAEPTHQILWQRTVGGEGEDWLASMAADDTGLTLAMTLRTGADAANQLLAATVLGPTDAIFSRLDWRGEPRGSERLGGADSDAALEIVSSPAGVIRMARYAGEVGRLPLPSGGEDIWLAGPCGPAQVLASFGGEEAHLSTDGRLLIVRTTETATFGGLSVPHREAIGRLR